MNEAVISIRMTDPMLREASQHAERDGVSVEQWLLSVAEERIRVEQVSARFFSRTPRETDGQTLIDILDSTSDAPPMPGDELPEEFPSTRRA